MINTAIYVKRLSIMTCDNYTFSKPRISQTPSLSTSRMSQVNLTTNDKTGAHKCSEALTPIALRYADNAISQATRNAVQSDLNHFIKSGGSIPATPIMIANYLADHAGQASFATMKRRLSSISNAHKELRLASPTIDPLIARTLKGIRRVHGSKQKQAEPLMVDDIRMIVSIIGHDLAGLRDKALILIGFASALRRSELRVLNVDDLLFHNKGVRINVLRSKTDQYAEGRTVFVARSGEATCPVSATQAWLAAAMIMEGPIFRGIDRHGNLGVNPISGNAIATIVKTRAKAIGIDNVNLSAHSLRAGYATSAAAAGYSGWRIRQQTGHKSMQMLERYVRLDQIAQHQLPSYLV